MRLDKLLANVGYGTRTDVKKIIRSGSVKVDEVVSKDPSQQVDPVEQRITVRGESLLYREFVYFMLNKPDGVVSATEDRRDSTVVDLLSEEDRAWDVFPVGRLDKDTEGLLLLTNDGKLTHSLLAPKKHIPKTYYAKIEGRVTIEDAEVFAKGVVLEDGYETMPAKLTILHTELISEIELTIYEGKYHQVKRMFEAVGKKVLYLKRLSMGNLELDPQLSLGQYRELTQEELDSLQSSQKE